MKTAITWFEIGIVKVGACQGSSTRLPMPVLSCNLRRYEWGESNIGLDFS